MRFKSKRILFVAILLAGGCGQKGPLFLPEEAPTNQEQPEDTNNTDKETDKKDG